MRVLMAVLHRGLRAGARAFRLALVLGLVGVFGWLGAGQAGAQIFQSGARDGIGGTYAVDGLNPDGTKYGGIAKISVVGDDVTVNWWVGSTAYTGTGTYIGDRRLRIEWPDKTQIVFSVGNDGTLSGTWANGAGARAAATRAGARLCKAVGVGDLPWWARTAAEVVNPYRAT